RNLLLQSSARLVIASPLKTPKGCFALPGLGLGPTSLGGSETCPAGRRSGCKIEILTHMRFTTRRQGAAAGFLYQGVRHAQQRPTDVRGDTGPGQLVSGGERLSVAGLSPRLLQLRQ